MRVDNIMEDHAIVVRNWRAYSTKTEWKQRTAEVVWILSRKEAERENGTALVVSGTAVADIGYDKSRRIIQ